MGKKEERSEKVVVQHILPSGTSLGLCLVRAAKGEKKKKSWENQENLGGCATAALTDKSVAALQKNSKPVQPQSRLRLLPAEVDLGIL